MTDKSCNCRECAALCRGRPGWFMPGEATRAASELGMRLPDFFQKYLTVDYWSPDRKFPRGVDVLSPAWTPSGERASPLEVFRLMLAGAEPTGSNAGRRAGWADPLLGGPCALLTSKGCRLSFDARPRECREAYGCEKAQSVASLKRRRLACVRAWQATPDEISQVSPSDGGTF